MKKIRIYGNSTCGYTKAARNFCIQEKLDFEFFDIENDAVSAAEYQKLSEQFTHFSTPLIMTDEKFIGGYVELYMAVKHAKIEE